MAGVLFEDIFDVKDVDPDGKKFDRGKGQGVNFSSFFLSFVVLSVLLYNFVTNQPV